MNAILRSQLSTPTPAEAGSRGRMLIAFPLFVAILLTPMLFGGTTQGGQLILDSLCGFCFVGLIGHCWYHRVTPNLPLTFWVPLAVLAFIGACQVTLPRYEFDAEAWEFASLERGLPCLPGTVDASASKAALVHFLAIVAASIVLFSVSKDYKVRWWMIRAIALSGFVVALVGIGQKAGGADAMLWSSTEESGPHFFAAFRYHGNAAAFLNLSWPASLALLLRYANSPRKGLARSFWLVSLVVTLSAVFVNSSKTGQFVAGILVALIFLRFRKELPIYGRGWLAPSLGAALLVVFFAIAIFPTLSTTLQKWDEMFAEGSTWKGRLAAYQVCLVMLPDSGVWGNGIGTFRLVFPFYTEGSSDVLGGFWYHAHQDYLQTWIEWGAVGFLAFGMILVSGILRAFRKVAIAKKNGQVEISTSCALIGVFTGLLHAGVDFPLQIPAIQLVFVSWFAISQNAKTNPVARKVSHHAYTTDARMQHAGVRRVSRDLEAV